MVIVVLLASRSLVIVKVVSGVMLIIAVKIFCTMGSLLSVVVRLIARMDSVTTVPKMEGVVQVGILAAKVVIQIRLTATLLPKFLSVSVNLSWNCITVVVEKIGKYPQVGIRPINHVIGMA
jgi:hypothetical protein